MLSGHMSPSQDSNELPLQAHIPGTASPIPSPAPKDVDATTDASADFKPTMRFWLAFMTLAVLTLMVALDGTTLSVALPRIAHELHGTGIQTFWAGTSFLLTATVFQPNYASFSHIFGRKPLILLALTFFLAGTLVGGLAHDFTLLLIGRSLQGVGGGGVIAMTEIVVTDLVPLRLRGQWFGIISAMWSVSQCTHHFPS